jgi:protein-arginine kinase activator protein McsA
MIIKDIEGFVESFIKENEWQNENNDPLKTCRTCNKHTRKLEDLLDKGLVKCLEASQQAKAPIFTDVDGCCKLWEAIP